MKTETVKFDVGGTKYTVSRSLIDAYPATMLARLVSETWQKDPKEEIFIERDGLRFRCILDYMRDQKVHVPINTTKASVLQDLEYFGFEHIPDGAIDVHCANILARDHCATMHREYKEHMQKRAEEYVYDLYACECSMKYAAGVTRFSIDHTFRRELAKAPKLNSIFSPSLLEGYLSKLGLHGSNYSCTSGDSPTYASFNLSFTVSRLSED